MYVYITSLIYLLFIYLFAHMLLTICATGCLDSKSPPLPNSRNVAATLNLNPVALNPRRKTATLTDSSDCSPKP